jgi:hypothetical protein
MRNAVELQKHIDALRGELRIKEAILEKKKAVAIKLSTQIASQNALLSAYRNRGIVLINGSRKSEGVVSSLVGIIALLVLVIVLFTKTTYDQSIVIESQDTRAEWLVGEYNRMNHELKTYVEGSCLKRIPAFEGGFK